MNPRFPAPAKINLFLHVVGRRADGYHLLQTAFQFLSLCDYLDLSVREDGQVLRAQELVGVPAEADLCVRAAQALKAATACPLGVTIALEKHIPMGGGLGGGSSNAATVLVALNRLWGLQLPTQRLAELGLALGADVPVFVHGQAAFAEGVGERLTPIEPPTPSYVLLRPDCAIPTAEIFKAPELTRNTSVMTIADLAEEATRNDCEPVVRMRYPPVAQALDWLGSHAPARLTGTGSCVFAPFPGTGQAEQVAAAARERGWQAWAVRGLNRSPLLDVSKRCW